MYVIMQLRIRMSTCQPKSTFFIRASHSHPGSPVYLSSYVCLPIHLNLSMYVYLSRPKSKKSLGPIVCIYLASYVYLTMIICLYVLSSSSPSLCLWAVMSPFIRHITVSILSHTLNWGVAFACPRGFLVICL